MLTRKHGQFMILAAVILAFFAFWTISDAFNTLMDTLTSTGISAQLEAMGIKQEAFRWKATISWAIMIVALALVLIGSYTISTAIE